ncbi:hypothetical protein ACHAXR_010920 [Thalassiosira sp. AJA248-18]
MLVSGFMIPYDKVLKCEASNTVREVLNLLTDWHVSCLVVALDDKPTGIITTTDMCWCYHNGVSLDSQVGDIMPWTAGLKKIESTVDRDTAAKFFEKNKVHHAVVVDGNNKPVGLISSLDIATEVAKDARAWPWNRHEDGKIHAVVSR